MADERDLRYGISALDIAYKEHAVNDELLVDGLNGQMLYKRSSDGQIVTFSSAYDKDDLINAVAAVFKEVDEVPTLSTDFIVYNTISGAGKLDILASGSQIIGENVFISDKPNSGFFVRISGGPTTNAIAAYLKSKYISEHVDNTYSAVTMTFEIVEMGVNITKTITVNGDFDKLIFVPLCENFVPTTGCTGYKISLKTITFPLLKESYNALNSNEVKLVKDLNNNNHKLEASMVDILYYVTDCTNAAIYDTDTNIKLNYIVPASDTHVKDDFVVSEIKPSYKCIWAKIRH